ncbi:MAG: alpha-glucan family phosphorylase [Patescibacteria group bacterium]
MLKDYHKSIVAYFSMEIAVENEIKTYAGGLGVLAGDILKSAARLGFPMVGITLLNNKGYFEQKITSVGEQAEQPDSAYNFSRFKKLDQQVTVTIGSEKVTVGVWQYLVKGAIGFVVPIYFLDTDITSNSTANRQLSGQLYGGDREYRLKQEIILGRAGVKMLRALGYDEIKRFHLNEAHGSLAAVELFLNSEKKTDSEKIKEVRGQCVFTTHTPVSRGQDVFSLAYLKQFQPDFPDCLKSLVEKGEINFTFLGLYLSAFANAVSRQHRLTAQKMFPKYKIRAITNGVDSLFWTAPEFKKLYDKYLPGWRLDNGRLHLARKIPLAELRMAHQKNKKKMVEYINHKKSADFKKDIFTICFARRFAPYKRPEFLLSDLNRLLALRRVGEIQIVYAGKAHPQDMEGRELIKEIWMSRNKLAGKIKMVFLENYDLEQARLLTAGADVWLNTPLPPNEASGTSGMKAAHNGVPQLSTLDGWWPEGYKKNKTGWAIKETGDVGRRARSNLYDLLEKEILPLYYQSPEKWEKLRRSVISLNASVFNAERMLRQYIKEAY